MSLHSDN